MSKAAKVLFNGETQFELVTLKILQLESELRVAQMDKKEAVRQTLIDYNGDRNKVAKLLGYTFVQLLTFCHYNKIPFDEKDYK